MDMKQMILVLSSQVGTSEPDKKVLDEIAEAIGDEPSRVGERRYVTYDNFLKLLEEGIVPRDCAVIFSSSQVAQNPAFALGLPFYGKGGNKEGVARRIRRNQGPHANVLGMGNQTIAEAYRVLSGKSGNGWWIPRDATELDQWKYGGPEEFIEEYLF